MKKIIVINSHPIQYFAPLYSFCTTQNINLEVWYCSDENLNGGMDKEFGTNIKWDIPLLEGYKFKFFKNNSWKPSSSNGFWGLINLGVFVSLFRQPQNCVVVIHGWGYFTTFFSVIFAKLAGHKVAIRGESPLNQELRKSKLNYFLKIVFFKKFLFRFVDYFLFIGKQNKAFYKYFGAKEEELFFTPYAVDNDRFQHFIQSSKERKSSNKLNFIKQNGSLVLLFSGKYIEKKRPLILLEAFKLLANSNLSLVMIGEGRLRKDMEDYVISNNLKNVFLTGFINQSEISEYYKLADIFIMCSGDGETWGLTVNEAMNFGLPLLISDRVGSKDDLILEGTNGFSFQLDNLEDMVDKLSNLISMDIEQRNKMGEKSLRIINKYSYDTIAETLIKIASF